MALDPFHLVKTGWQGVPVIFAGTVWATPPTLHPDGTVDTPGVGADLSEWTFLFTVKRHYTDLDAAAIYRRDWRGGGTDGSWGYELPDTSTVAMDPATYVWDTKVIRFDGQEPEMFLAGTLIIQKTVTRRFVPQL